MIKNAISDIFLLILQPISIIIVKYSLLYAFIECFLFWEICFAAHRVVIYGLFGNHRNCADVEAFGT